MDKDLLPSFFGAKCYPFFHRIPIQNMKMDIFQAKKYQQLPQKSKTAQCLCSLKALKHPLEFLVLNFKSAHSNFLI